MSGILVGWAFEQHCSGPGEKFVLVKLADNANDDGVCWPSIASIARHCEMSERSVQNHLRALEARGLISTEPQTAKTGMSLPNLYRLRRVQPLHPRVQDLHPGGLQGNQLVTDGGVQPLHPRVQITTAPPSPPYIEEPSLKNQSPNGDSSAERRRLCEKMVEIWHGSGLARVRKLTPARQQKLHRRLMDELDGSLEEWSALVRRIVGSRFLMGDPGPWRVDFDFVLSQTNMVKILEGKYDDRKPNGNGSAGIPEPRTPQGPPPEGRPLTDEERRLLRPH